MKSYPLITLLEDWRVVIENLGKEVRTLKDREKKKTLYLICRKLRLSLIAYFAPLKCKWWDTKRMNLMIQMEKEVKEFFLKIFEEDRVMYGVQIGRMLATEAWIMIEAHFRGKSAESISKILTRKFGVIPPAIDTLRLLRNCWHNLGVHTGQSNVEYVVRGWSFKFKKNKPVKNFHLAAIVQLIDEAAIELIRIK